jgi:hypothetical protein
MIRLIPFIILVIDIIVIIDIIKSHKDTERKVLWIVAVVCLPAIGPILYYLFGKNR